MSDATNGNHGNTDGPVRVILWGTPRSMSTAFLKAMTQLEDSIMWHEPYLTARRMAPEGSHKEKYDKMMEQMFKSGGFNGMGKEGLMAAAKSLPFGYEAMGCSYQWIKDQLEAEAPGKKLIFCKDMVEGIEDRKEMIPSGFRHVFLIRHPAKVFKSFKKMVVSSAVVTGSNEPTDLRKRAEIGLLIKGYFYTELAALVTYVRENCDSSPVIICTDDLLKNPEGVMKAFCKEVNLPYTDKLINNWADDGHKILGKWMVSKEMALGLHLIHANAFASTGFSGEPSPIPDVSTLDEDVQEVVAKCMPFYEKIYAARLVATAE